MRGAPPPPAPCSHSIWSLPADPDGRPQGFPKALPRRWRTFPLPPSRQGVMNLFFARPVTSVGPIGSHRKHVIREGRRPTLLTKLLAVLAAAFCMQGLVAMTAAKAALAPVGNGFTVTAGDLSFILKQIKISERHATTLTGSNPCGTLVAQPGDGIPDTEQVPDYLTSYGLRTVDGSCNNLKDATTANFAASDQVFPRLTTPNFRDAEPITPAIPVGPPGPTSYKQKQGNVVDSQPRVISNLIVEQTSTNRPAGQAAGQPVRTQTPNEPSAVPCTTDPQPVPAPGSPGSPAG